MGVLGGGTAVWKAAKYTRDVIMDNRNRYSLLSAGSIFKILEQQVSKSTEWFRQPNLGDLTDKCPNASSGDPPSNTGSAVRSMGCNEREDSVDAVRLYGNTFGGSIARLGGDGSS